MAIDKRAGQPAQQSDLINVAQLTAQYYVLKPEVGNAEHAVKFGTSGHRGSAARHNFNEPHILAIARGHCGRSCEKRYHRSVLCRQRYPRPLRAGVYFGAGSVNRQRRRRDRAGKQRLHPDAGGLQRDSGA